MSSEINRPMPACGARRILTQEIVLLPILRRPHRPRHEASAAIGTDITQHLFDTCGAERTFVAANACFSRTWGQHPVAMLADGSQF